MGALLTPYGWLVQNIAQIKQKQTGSLLIISKTSQIVFFASPIRNYLNKKL